MSSEVKLRPMEKRASPLKAATTTSVDMETLSHAQTCQKRNTHLHNLSIEMLCHGYHRAYTELFNLVESRRRARVEQGPGGPMSQEIKLEAENHYLDKLKEHLCAAEESERSKQYQKQYTHIHDLANYFRDEKITWVSDHFFIQSLSIAHKVAFDSGKSLCEANEQCALAYEQNGLLQLAHDHLVNSRKASRGRTNWRHEDSDLTWHQENSKNLTRILLKMANDENDKIKRKELHVQACKAADESKLELSIAEAHYAFGRYHPEQDNTFPESQDALQKALQAACKITHHGLIQKITKELASLWKKRGSSTTQMNGLSQRSIEFLQLAVEKTADNPVASIAALSEMALLYNACGQFEHATASIDRAYLALGQMGDSATQEHATRVASGAIHANKGLLDYRRRLATSKDDPETLRQILRWKTSGD